MVNKAFVFPGQGSQTIGMLKELAGSHSIIQATFEQASEAIQYDIWHMVQNGPENKLNQTEHTQVAMLTADVAVFNVLQSKGLTDCRMMAGHSLGEYAALVCSKALDLKDAAVLVAKRGQLMQETIPLGAGAMAAIVGLDNTLVQSICKQASSEQEQVSPANYNAIGQVVIAGHTPAVERAVELALNNDAKLAKKIPVSVPCHCPLLKEAAGQFEATLAETTFETPSLDVISNVDLQIYQSADQIRARLKEQLFSPVRWVETIQFMQKSGVELIIECGPGKVLTGLTKRIDRSLKAISAEDMQGLEQIKTISHSVI